MKGLFAAGDEWVSFEKFMEHALHDPRCGYYSRRISTVGRGGDFTTTAEISPALPKAIARWLRVRLRETKCVDVIELGPGSGALAAKVIASLPWWMRWRVRWHLVESAETLRARQQQRKELKGSRWHESVEAALAACDGAACLYSNEFFDAFAVRVFRKCGEAWQEMGVKRNAEGRLEESFVTVEHLPDSSVWSREWPDGQRVEVHDSVRQWLMGLAEHWRRGAMLGIDYGASVERMHHGQRGGSLRAYLLQQRIVGAGVYENIGRQDITADVNFTDLMAWCDGFATEQRVCTQAEFLAPFVDGGNAGDRHAIDPMGAGQAFQVWECRLRG
jgi:SAM-dependent MidA family methyltransferase